MQPCYKWVLWALIFTSIHLSSNRWSLANDKSGQPRLEHQYLIECNFSKQLIMSSSNRLQMSNKCFLCLNKFSWRWFVFIKSGEKYKKRGYHRVKIGSLAHLANFNRLLASWHVYSPLVTYRVHWDWIQQQDPHHSLARASNHNSSTPAAYIAHTSILSSPAEASIITSSSIQKVFSNGIFRLAGRGFTL